MCPYVSIFFFYSTHKTLNNKNPLNKYFLLTKKILYLEVTRDGLLVCLINYYATRDRVPSYEKIIEKTGFSKIDKTMPSRQDMI